jgi:hypothetical protein
MGRPGGATFGWLLQINGWPAACSWLYSTRDLLSCCLGSDGMVVT